jgi:hypothetical protein
MVRQNTDTLVHLTQNRFVVVVHKHRLSYVTVHLDWNIGEILKLLEVRAVFLLF